MRAFMKLAAAASVAALAAIATTATPAFAVGQPTSASFTINGGSLSISVPGSVTFPAVTASAVTAGGSLGNVVVTDNRGLFTGTWTATVTSTDFVSTNTTIPAGSILYTAGPAPTTGTVALSVPGTGTLSNSTPLIAQASVSLLGSDTATWNPTLAITIPSTATAGTYSATVTHSVA